MSGPLAGVTVIEMAGLGPAPFCAMMLADMGANVVRIDRYKAGDALSELNISSRGVRSIALDLKTKRGVEVARRLIGVADALIEGFRPGVMEKLGLGPVDCHALNGRLVYGRMTGWGQDGPLAHAAGHDINYIALSGVLSSIGPRDGPPMPPLNLIGDYGGGGVMLALGVVSALLHARTTGQGQVVDMAMVNGAAALATMIFGMQARGHWIDERGANLLDGSAPFYGVYACADGKWVSIGSIEAKFHAEMLERVGVDAAEYGAQYDRSQWPRQRALLASVFAQRTRDEWTNLLEGTDACFAPVLTLQEAPSHPQNVVRGVFTEVKGGRVPGPPIRYSATPCEPGAPSTVGADTTEILTQAGFTSDDVESLRSSGVIN